MDIFIYYRIGTGFNLRISELLDGNIYLKDRYWYELYMIIELSDENISLKNWYWHKHL